MKSRLDHIITSSHHHILYFDREELPVYRIGIVMDERGISSVSAHFVIYICLLLTRL